MVCASPLDGPSRLHMASQESFCVIVKQTIKSRYSDLRARIYCDCISNAWYVQNIVLRFNGTLRGHQCGA